MWKAAIAVAVALAFILPGSATVANVGTPEATSKNTVGINNIEGTIMSDTPRVDNSKNEHNLGITENALIAEKTIDTAILITRGTVYVDDNAPPEWYDATHVHTITQGVTAAITGDTVYVYNGTYYDHVTVSKRLNLVGENRENVIVNGNGSGNVIAISSSASQVTITTFTIKNGSYGVYSSSKNNKVTDCNIYGHSTSGIYNYGAGSLGCNYTDCAVHNNGIGVYFYNSPSNALVNCEVYDNSNYGIYLRGSRYTNLTDTAINNGTFYISSSVLVDFYQYIDTSNTLNGKTIYYLVGQSNTILDETDNVGYLGLISCTNITARNSDVNGVMVVGTTNSTISNISSHHGRDGIYLWLSSNTKIINCTSYNNSMYGFYFSESLDSNLEDNAIYNNLYDFWVASTDISHFYHTIDTSNTVNGKPIYYLIAEEGLGFETIESRDFDGTAMGFLGLISCKEITVENLDLYGILMVNVSNSTISNISTHNNYAGLYSYLSSNNEFTNCHFYNNYIGCYMWASSKNNFRDCDSYGNSNAGYYFKIAVDNNNFTNCDSHGNLDKSISFTSSNNNNFTNCDFYRDARGPYIDKATHNNFINCNFHDMAYLFYVASGSHYTNLTNCNIYNGTSRGISVSGSNWATIVNCTVYNITGGDGGYFYIELSSISDCTFYNNTIGIRLFVAKNNKIENCVSYNNDKGFSLQDAQNNIIVNCSSFNNNYGIYSLRPTGNVIHHNNFYNNTQNALDVTSNTNQWDDNISEGNYWDNYTGVDANGDGIGDTPYNISGGSNKDRYPLMLPLDTTPPMITNVQATPNVQKPNEPMNITCIVTDNWNMVNTVKINISGPGGFTLDAPMNHGSSYYYNNSYTTLGVYYYFIWANDTQRNIATSGSYSFVITDLDKPTSSVNPLPLWKTTTPFTIIAIAYDNTAVANVTFWYRYSTNGTSWTAWTSYGTDEDAPWSWSFTGSDGYYQFYSIAVDDYGNIEDSPGAADASTGIDTVKPVTTIILTGTTGANNWYKSSITVTLSATDALSGVNSTWYKLDAGYWTIYTVPFTVSAEGQHTVSYYSFDHAGNQEVANSVSFKIDTIAPITTHTLVGFIGSQGWYVTNVTVTLSANDATSGVNYTKYKLNTGDWIVYTGFFVVTTDGNYTLYYYSVDFAGNTETTKQVAFRIQHDVTPPVTTHEFGGVMGENNWFIGAVTVTLTAVDDSAGVASTTYKLDAGTWTPYIGAFLITGDAAAHSLSYYSVDKVGNTESVKEATLKIDRTKPTINLTVEKTGLSKWLLTANVHDNTSGIARVEFYLDGILLGNKTASPYEWNCTTKGTAQAIVYDNAGNNAVSAAVPVSQSVDGQSQSSSSTSVLVSKNTIQSQSISSTLQRLFNLR
jgi:parallel beta-helix repeat protein